MKYRALVPIESRLEGVDRQNLKIINLSTHYKPGLALERESSPGERGKQINQEIKRANTEREMCPWAISKYFGDLVSNTSA
jgi:hypothetical protein